MAKIMTTMTIDDEIYKKFQRKFPQQASSFCEESMRKRLQLEDMKVESVNQVLLSIEKEKLQKVLDEANSKMSMITEQEKEIEQNIREGEMKKLQEEKERVESMGRCGACGCQISDVLKKIMVGDKQFCKDCFFNEHPAFMKAQKEARGKKDDSAL